MGNTNSTESNIIDTPNRPDYVDYMKHNPKEMDYSYIIKFFESLVYKKDT